MIPSAIATIAAGITRNYTQSTVGIEHIPQTMLATANPLGNSIGVAWGKILGLVVATVS